jgi:hypothetical protein
MNVYRDWDCSRAVPFLGIFISHFRYSIFAVLPDTSLFLTSCFILDNIYEAMNISLVCVRLFL